MTISVNDFPKIEELVLRRKLLLDFAAHIDATDYTRITIRGKKDSHFSMYGDAFLYVESEERKKKIKEIAFFDCHQQIAEIEIKLLKFGISLDA